MAGCYHTHGSNVSGRTCGRWRLAGIVVLVKLGICSVVNYIVVDAWINCGRGLYGVAGVAIACNLFFSRSHQQKLMVGIVV